MSALISVDGLVKEFRKVKPHEGRLGSLRTLFTRRYEVNRAVDGVSFAIDEGELVGYLGPNGAGKSTTIKMMTGIVMPTGGTVRISGLDPWRERPCNAAQMGVVFGQRTQLWWDLPLRESFRLVGAIYGVSPADYRESLERFVDLLDLGEFIDRPVRQLSLGQRMRGDIAAAMLHRPRVVYLDEPTIGLDVVAKDRMRTFVEETSRAGETTIVLTTHDLADVERLCPRVILIDHGRVLYDGDVQGLKATYATHRELVVHLAPDESTGRTPAVRAADVLGAEIVSQEQGVARIRFEASRIAVQHLIASVNQNYPVRDLSIVEPDLEGVVRRIYSEGLTP
ncbi:ABC transporter ATP-binding protein [Streptomyces jumonjinensis]|uniref:ATP-binding cassette domain-containing protein n=1 Tax=Streptomyces jumonjinensis TaxID=1945 RepID=A0A646KAV8_STRJU|nr:ATP-binding cassette domain-containing protein [Streptomyces jumonjinensis]MQS99046.1 ATP-binding cassette domain-containing protein [Streptomyces jumonjinensis]